MQQIAQRYTGTPMRRLEDRRILTGTGKYVDDVTLPGMVHAAFLRSPYAHARIVSIDTASAVDAPGVIAVYTGADIEAQITTGGYGITVMMGTAKPVHTCLAVDKVRLVGDLVALVIADSRREAEDATELIFVEYEELPAVVTAEHAFDSSRPPIFEDLGSNIFNETGPTDYGDVEGVFARADHVLATRISQHRLQNVPMETRGCVVSYEPDTGQLTMWSANQSVSQHRGVMASRLGMEPEKIRILTADVGGSFGLKIAASREDVAVAVTSRQLGRPVKYIEDRYENLTASGQAREEYFDIEAAYTDEGDILGLKVKMVIDTGAYPGLGGALGQMIQMMFPSAYKIEALRFESKAIVTNKATYIAYRGPWAAETFVRERVIDLIARELEMEPLDVRLRNVVARDQEPKAMITGRSLAGVTVKESLELVQEMIDLPAFRRRQEAARAEGRYIGMGLASYIEAAPGPRGDGPALGGEQMRMELADDGTVVVYSGQMPHGQSHETTFSQIAADEFGVAIENVRFVFGDSDVVPPGQTGGSRAATMTGGATLTSARALRAKVLEAASHLMEASPDDLTINDGAVMVAGVPASAMPLADVAAAMHQPGRLPDDFDSRLVVEITYDGGKGGWAGGTHCTVVEVDVETGLVRFERYLVVEDCGEMINPAIVEGQVRGGVAQGIGAVLLERSAYDEQGNFLSGTFMDYLMPTTMDIPRIEISHLETVRLDEDVNFRGVGEGGMIIAPPTICNAIEDALAPFGVRIHEQHLPPARILELAGIIDVD